MDGLDRFGVLFVDDELLEESPELYDVLDEKAGDLIAEAQSKFDEFLSSLGLESVMGVIRKKGE